MRPLINRDHLRFPGSVSSITMQLPLLQANLKNLVSFNLISSLRHFDQPIEFFLKL